MGTAGRGRRRAATALVVAVLVHLALLAVLAMVPWTPQRIRGRARAPAPTEIATPPPTIVAAISLIEVAVPALTVEAVTGPGDSVGLAGTHPLPRASADLPGRRAAERGGGADGGPATWTGRRDKADDAALRAEVWNGAEDYRSPHRDVDRAPRSPEALSRQPDRDYGDRQAAPKASAGEAVASRGDATGVGAGTGELPSWRDADPIFDQAAGQTTPARTSGAPQATREDALAAIGAASDDVHPRGRAGDDRAAAAASDQRKPDPFDWTPPRSGADAGEGVAGRSGDGVLRDGRGRGDAATRADVPTGAADLSITAARTDPYFRNLYRQLDRLVGYPRDLAIGLYSGWLIAVMTLAPDGRVTAISVERSSGYPGFDDALTSGLRRVVLGPVPARLLEGRRELRVRIPYTFRNPLVR